MMRALPPDVAMTVCFCLGFCGFTGFAVVSSFSIKGIGLGRREPLTTFIAPHHIEKKNTFYNTPKNNPHQKSECLLNPNRQTYVTVHP